MIKDENDLQSILDTMFASGGKLTFETVRDWQRRFPQFRREIAEAAAAWREFEFLALEDDAGNLPELSVTAKTALEKALTKFRTANFETITNLRETAKEKGVGREKLPQMLGVSETLMRKIERHNLNEIPHFIEAKLVAIFQVSAESWRKFFDLSPTLSPAVQYKSKNAPQTQPKQSFAEAVRDDPELTAEQKRELLDLIANEES